MRRHHVDVQMPIVTDLAQVCRQELRDIGKHVGVVQRLQRALDVSAS
jgi:hypothetical protein